MKTITPEYVVVITSRDREVMIPLKQVEKMTVYDREFDEVTTVFAVAGAGIFLLLLLSPIFMLMALGNIGD